MVNLAFFQRISLNRALLVGTVAAVAWSQPYRPMIFIGDSMSPTYQSGSIAMTVPVDGNLKVGDIVLIERPTGTIVKRIANLPGDQIVQMVAGGEWIDASSMNRSIILDSDIGRLYTIPAGHVYVLGDNAQSSTDSRAFGPVPITSIVRKLVNPQPRAPIASEVNPAQSMPRHRRTIPARPLSVRHLDLSKVVYRPTI